MANKSSKPKFTLVEVVHDWVKQKLEAGEGFSVLLATNHSDGQRLTKYAFDTVELALQRCEEELKSELADASSYAFVFDARTKITNRLVPTLIFQMEEIGQGTSTNFSQAYEMKKRFFSAKLKFHAKENFQPMGPNKPFLAANV